MTMIGWVHITMTMIGRLRVKNCTLIEWEHVTMDLIGRDIFHQL